MRILPALVALALLAVAPAARAADQTLIWDHGCCAPQAIDVGDTVTFDTVVVEFGSHPLVWDTGDFATQSTGTSQAYTFATAGTYAFHCQFHSDMAGTITVGANAHPTVDFTFAPAEPRAGETVTFTATGADADGTVASYRWDLDGNGSFERTTTQPTVTKVYAAAGTFAVKVQAVDNGHDASAAAVKSVPVAAAPGTNTGAGPPDTGGPAGGTPDGAGTMDGAGAGGSPQTT
ncbi:MAG: hypothetical protein JWM73_1159, partial [Solirubrobacterales bacterium]|nr:hypothetical protein [Solirubrobacterales bacterium]